MDAVLLDPLPYPESQRLPLAMGAGSEDRGSRWLAVFGRLRPGTTLSQAEAEMMVLARRHERAYPETNPGWAIDMEPLHEVMVGELRPTLRCARLSGPGGPASRGWCSRRARSWRSSVGQAGSSSPGAFSGRPSVSWATSFRPGSRHASTRKHWSSA